MDKEGMQFAELVHFKGVIQSFRVALSFEASFELLITCPTR